MNPISHPCHKWLSLPTQHKVTALNELRNAANDDDGGPRWRKVMSQTIAYDSITYEKACEQVATLETLARELGHKAKTSERLLVKAREHLVLKHVEYERLQEELVEARNQCEDSGPTDPTHAAATNIAANWHPHGIGPAKLLTGEKYLSP